jgi:hypothetical protein
VSDQPTPAERHPTGDEGQSSVRAVPYKGADLDAERGPGLGCFRFQLVLLAVLIGLTPISVANDWPTWLSAALLFATIGLLLIAGQTIIFLLRLVAADRRGRRRPLASTTRTVGEIEASASSDEPSPAEADAGQADAGQVDAGQVDAGSVRQ